MTGGNGVEVLCFTPLFENESCQPFGHGRDDLHLFWRHRNAQFVQHCKPFMDGIPPVSLRDQPSPKAFCHPHRLPGWR